MRLDRTLLIAGLSLALMACGRADRGADAREAEPGPIEQPAPATDVPTEIAGLDDIAAREQAISAAGRGDAQAAARLANYYWMANANRAERERWLKRAVELGHNPSRLNYALLLYDKGGRKNCEAALALIGKYVRNDPGDRENAGYFEKDIRADKAACSW